jgi:hypothetical protein
MWEAQSAELDAYFYFWLRVEVTTSWAFADGALSFPEASTAVTQ